MVIVILIFMFVGNIQEQGAGERLFRPEREELTKRFVKIACQASRFVLLISPNKEDQILEDDIDGACSTNGREENCLPDFHGKT